MSFVEFRLLGGKLATFGYERSSLAREVRRLLTAAQLDDVVVRRFDTYLPVLTIPATLRPAARRLARAQPVSADVLRDRRPARSAPQGDATD